MVPCQPLCQGALGQSFQFFIKNGFFFSLKTYSYWIFLVQIQNQHLRIDPSANLIMNQRLQAFLTTNNTIDRAQIGFMPKSRTTDHIFTLKTLCRAITTKLGNSITILVLFCTLV